MPEKLSIDVDNEKISGVLHREKNDTDVCVISCHGLLANKDSIKYVSLAEELVSHGLSSFRFDFRGCGESDGMLEKSHISSRLTDLETVMNFVIEDLGFTKIGLFGSSMGGYVSYLQASRDNRVAAMVTLSSPFSMAELFNAYNLYKGYFEIDGFMFGNPFLTDIKKRGTLKKEMLENIKCPVLIFHGDSDWLVPSNHAQRLFENIKTEKMLKIIKNGDHIFSNPLHLNEIIRTSVDWYQKYLKEV